MGFVACTVVLLAATSVPPALPSAPANGYSNEEALRRYATGRLLEERGETGAALQEYYRALVLDRGASSIARRVSESAARRGDAERSLEFATRALAADPEDARSRWLRGTALFNLGRLDQALQELEHAVRIDSTEADYLRALSRVAEQADRYDRVAFASRRLIDLDDQDGEAWFQLAAAEARLGRFVEARAAIDRSNALNPVRPGALFLEGWILEGGGQPERAIDRYRRHLRVHPNDQGTRRRLVNVLGRNERFGEAHQEISFLARALPDDPEIASAQADLAFRAGRASEGNKALRRLIQLGDEDAETMANAAGVLARNGRAKEALALADHWAKERPANHRGPMLRAQARVMAKDPEGAIAFARAAVAMAPDSLAPRLMLGQIQQQANRWAAAESTWLEVARRRPDRLDFALELAHCKEQQGDVDGAERIARETLAKEPDDPRTLNFLGYLLADHKRKLPEAEALIRRAVAQEPDNGAYIDSMGWVYYRLGRLDEARRELERAVELTDGDPVVREHLGDVYKDLSLNDLARTQYRMSLARDTTNSRIRAKLAGLR